MESVLNAGATNHDHSSTDRSWWWAPKSHLFLFIIFITSALGEVGPVLMGLCAQISAAWPFFRVSDPEDPLISVDVCSGALWVADWSCWPCKKKSKALLKLPQTLEDSGWSVISAPPVNKKEVLAPTGHFWVVLLECCPIFQAPPSTNAHHYGYQYCPTDRPPSNLLPCHWASLDTVLIENLAAAGEITLAKVGHS